MERVNINDIFRKTRDLIKLDPITIYLIHEKPIVTFGILHDCNTEYCDKNNIQYFNTNRPAGCIVDAPGNISLVDIRDFKMKSLFDTTAYFSAKLLRDFVEFLKSKGLNAKFDHNDVMVDGYKVASGISFVFKPECKKVYTAVQFAINQDLEIIRNVCKKPMIKTPKGLSEFGITTEDVENWLIEYFK